MTEATIERTAGEIAQALRAIDEDDGKFCRYEYHALEWVLAGDYEYTPPRNHDDPEIGVTVSEIQNLIEKYEDDRKKSYANNATSHADGLAFGKTALEWVLGNNEAFDHVVSD